MEGTGRKVVTGRKRPQGKKGVLLLDKEKGETPSPSCVNRKGMKSAEKLEVVQVHESTKKNVLPI